MTDAGIAFVNATVVPLGLMLIMFRMGLTLSLRDFGAVVREPKPVVDALADEGIIVDFRPGIVRCSPAFYNTEEEVHLLVERLAAHVPDAGRPVS